MKLHYLLAMTVSLFALSLSACERRETPTEKVQDAVDDALDRRPAEKIQDAGEDLKEGVKDAVDDVKD